MKLPNFQDLILFENNDIVVVNKPPFISSLDDRNGETINMLRLAKQEYEDAQICHRLDRETSGALIFAKNPEAYRNVSMQFEHREVKKIYHAIADGQHRFENMEVDLPIGIGNKGVVRIDKAEGKAADTLFNTIQLFNHYTLIECQPRTGRMHQIRIHLATQRASISGDTLYGGKPFYLSKIKRGYKLSKDQEELPILKRFALHAKQVEFKLMNGDTILVDAPYPKDFDTGLKMLMKFDR
jgi:23S rRNA pseudouridine955/2504/2580 synthase